MALIITDALHDIPGSAGALSDEEFAILMGDSPLARAELASRLLRKRDAAGADASRTRQVHIIGGTKVAGSVPSAADPCAAERGHPSHDQAATDGTRWPSSIPSPTDEGATSGVQFLARISHRIPSHINRGLQAMQLVAAYDHKFPDSAYPPDLALFAGKVLALVLATRNRDQSLFAQLEPEVLEQYPAALRSARAALEALANPAVQTVDAPPSAATPPGGSGLMRVADVRVEPGRRWYQQTVDALKESIQESQLMQPIVVDGEATLVAGMHRLVAYRQLGRTEIPFVRADLHGLKRRLATLDENLIRRKLSVLEMAEAIIERQALFEELHPESKQHRIGGHAKAARAAGEIDALAPSFSQDTSRNIGLSTRSVQQLDQIGRIAAHVREVVRGEALGDNLTELVRLARVPPEQQKRVAQAVVMGKAKRVADAVVTIAAAATPTSTLASPYAISQAPRIRAFTARARHLRDEARALARGWAGADARMEEFTEIWDALVDAMDDVLPTMEKLELPRSCPCEGDGSCSKCGGGRWVGGLAPCHDGKA